MTEPNDYDPLNQPRIRRKIVRNILRMFVYFSLDGHARSHSTTCVLARSLGCCDWLAGDASTSPAERYDFRAVASGVDFHNRR